MAWPYVLKMHGCLICSGMGTFGMSYGMELLNKGLVQWELDVWDESGGYGIRNM